MKVSGNNASIASASERLVESIKDHESAKTAHKAAANVLRQMEDRLRAAHATEVEAHEALRSEMVARRKTRRS